MHRSPWNSGEFHYNKFKSCQWTWFVAFQLHRPDLFLLETLMDNLNRRDLIHTASIGTLASLLPSLGFGQDKPGPYDVHSPGVPAKNDMVRLR